LFTGAKEGWGITKNSKSNSLYVSDGSAKLFQINGDTFETEKIINVKYEDGTAVTEINELEYVNGTVWANIWQTNYIIAIDP
jgi:glutamine cyclotransferase